MRFTSAKTGDPIASAHGSHRGRPRTAAATVSATAAGSLIASGTKRPVQSEWWVPLNASHSDHSRGVAATDTAHTQTAAPTAIVKARHSRRTANQTTPTAAVAFVTSGNAHRAGAENPSTATHANGAHRLPLTISGATSTAATSRRRRGSGHSSQPKQPATTAAQTDANAGHGSNASGRIASANGGGYTNASRVDGSPSYTCWRCHAAQYACESQPKPSRRVAAAVTATVTNTKTTTAARLTQVHHPPPRPRLPLAVRRASA